MEDARLGALAGVVARAEGGACWLARLCMRAAAVGGAAGAVLWWLTAGDRVDEWWRGTATSLLVLGLCLLAAAWLLNVRFALLELVETPAKVSGIAARRAGQLGQGRRPERPDGGALQAGRSVYGIVRDYGDVVGSWGTVAQLLVPWFWIATIVAFAAVPLLVVAAVIVGLVRG